MKFYEAFKTSKQSNLKTFYRQYSPPITAEHHTCVGLSLELLKKLFELEDEFRGLTDCLYLVSCEECVEDVCSYVKTTPNPWDSDKEHVLVALNLDIAGRTGVLLLDPGYHIGRAITVMKDNLYPHTGAFIQSNESNCRKEYEYTFADKDGYVLWQIKETRFNSEKIIGNLVYISLPYLVPVDVTERRNLIYTFKCLVSRNAKGILKAGVYFNISKDRTEKFTVFYKKGDETKREKIPFNIFENDLAEMAEHQKVMLNECCNQLQLSLGDMINQLKTLYNITKDECFVDELLNIDRDIYNMGVE